LRLCDIKPDKSLTKKRKRVGRGNASGHGTFVLDLRAARCLCTGAYLI